MLQKILLVDDNETDLYVHKRRIIRHDDAIEVREAVDGQVALDLLLAGEFWPDLIFLDINMPHLDGFGFLDGCAREFPGRELTVVLALTSSFQDADIKRAQDYPVVKGHIIKPLSKHWYEELNSILAT